MKFELTVLGSNSAIPAHGRKLSAQLLNIKDELVLIDCGEGTLLQMFAYHIKYSKINHIFISHLHGDHIFGLVGLLTTYGLNRRKKTLNIYGPDGLDLIINVQLKLTETKLSYELVFHRTDPQQSTIVLDTPKFTVQTIPLLHRVPCNGYLFREKNQQRRINKSLIDHYDVPFTKISAIKEGADYTTPKGEVVTHQQLTLDPLPERSYAYCSDTMYTESILKLIEGIDLLYHEATFLHELLDKAQKTMHSTALQAASIAKQSKVKQLLIGHFSSRYQTPEVLEKEAQTIFLNTEAVQEGKTYPVGVEPILFK
ncbi:MAG: ribonuclease Z [Aureispira sp.]|nr:ribonuclease Z [Aureispira sp.]